MASSFMRLIDHTQRSTQSVVLLWTNNQLVAVTYAPHLQETDIHDPGGIRTHSLYRRAAANLRLILRGHRDLLTFSIVWYILFLFYISTHVNRHGNLEEIYCLVTIEEKFGTRHRRIVNCYSECINLLKPTGYMLHQ